MHNRKMYTFSICLNVFSVVMRLIIIFHYFWSDILSFFELAIRFRSIHLLPLDKFSFTCANILINIDSNDKLDFSIEKYFGSMVVSNRQHKYYSMFGSFELDKPNILKNSGIGYAVRTAQNITVKDF